ncbi:YezD family protein [Bacillus sp. Marseille-Q1617]|uniref:YezD family protein n=1 Tax=Bacillus sp. Marseille-Q1617 TaxID=2736887 RepID=UPI0020CA4F0B|nr:YezD family protein [Bacillus sp. Marseille-Q1617]
MADQDNQKAFDEVVKNVKSMLKTMKFGSITVVVQDGKVVQIEKNEKVRLK